MLLNILTQEFDRYFDKEQNNNLVLWFDNNKEYQKIIEYFSNIQIWSFERSYLELRHKLINRNQSEKIVVYLPLAQDDAEILRPFFATSFIFKKSLYKLLKESGFNFPSTPEINHEIRRLLPILAEKSIGKGTSFWDDVLLTIDKARSVLFSDNFDDKLLQYLTSPGKIDRDLEDKNLRDIFFDQLKSKYGIEVNPSLDQATLVQEIAAPFILVSLYKFRENQEKFPFSSKLPDPNYFEACMSFLSRWHRDKKYQMTYQRIADQLEKYYDLTDWVEAIPFEEQLSLPASFFSLEKIIWENVKKETRQLQSQEDWQTWLWRYKEKFSLRTDNIWSDVNRTMGWETIVQSADLLIEITNCHNDLIKTSSSREAFDQYLVSWWKIDQNFRILLETIKSKNISFVLLFDRCSRSYYGILRQMNSRFTELLEIEELWPPPEVPLPFQNRFWRETIDSNEQGKTAILYIDALRYELSHQLMESLDRDEAGQNRELSARLASIPTITPICMASLLPHGEDLTISYEDGWELSIGESRNLGDKGNRIKWLKEQLPKVTYLNLDEFITTPNNSIEIEKTIIIFDTTLDAVGENARQFSWTIFSELLKSITQAIHKLLNLGIDNIHVVTDHGFLLIEELGEHEKVKVKTSDALAVKPRYVIGNNLGRTDQLNYKLPKSKNLRVWFPHGIGCFRTPGPYSYVHGGLSLQELIVPQITITRQIIGNIVTIKAEVPKFINSAQFKIHVEAKESKMFDQPRQITIDLLKEKEKIIPTLSQVIKPGENYHLDILLPMGCGLQPNDEITWLIRDAYTEEILLKETAISKIDLW